MEPETATRLDPQGLMQIYMSMMPSRVLSAALQLDLFSRIAEGHETAGDLAKAAKASQRGIRMLLDGLCALGLLAKIDGRYRLPPASRTYLTRTSPDYVGAVMETDHFWASWGKLTAIVQTGRPAQRVESRAGAEAFFPILIRSLHVLNREPARRLAEVLGAGSSHRGLSVLDVGCGSAVWSIAFAEADPQARVTAQDFPAVLKETRAFVERHRLDGRFDYLPGDLADVAFGNQRWDLAILGNIVHSEGEDSARRLFGRLHTALRPQGRLVIVDFVPDEDRTGPAPAVLFALNMLINTESGDTFTLKEYQAWLGAAGFSAVATADIGEHIGARSPVIIATKA